MACRFRDFSPAGVPASFPAGLYACVQSSPTRSRIVAGPTEWPPQVCMHWCAGRLCMTASTEEEVNSRRHVRRTRLVAAAAATGRLEGTHEAAGMLCLRPAQTGPPCMLNTLACPISLAPVCLSPKTPHTISPPTLFLLPHFTTSSNTAHLPTETPLSVCHRGPNRRWTG